MFYQCQDKKAWLGPEKVFVTNGGDVFFFAKWNLRKVLKCNFSLSDDGVEIDTGK